ncbi:MAG: alpha/beta hydrolase [Acidobacteriota bacterium]
MGALIAVLGIALSCARAPREQVAGGRALDATIAEVEAGRRTTPLIVQAPEGGDATVTFLVESADGRVPRIVSDATGWGEDTADDSFDLTAGTMTRVGSTDWYRLDAKVAVGARIEYLIVHGETDYRTDPHNPRQAELRGSGPVSEFVTPGFVPPDEFADPPVVPAGRTTEAAIESRALRGSRRVIVYLPPGYRDAAAYPLAVFHSGRDVVERGEAPRVLDWLISHAEIEPVVGVFLESYRPGDVESHEGEPMRAFLSREVPAWVAWRCGVTTRPEERAILAISYGAKDALDAALAPARAYGRLGLLIPGRRLRRADLEAVARQRDRRLRAVILAGRYDRANLATARAARQALADAGHAVEYIEVPEGHNPATWRNHLRDVLVSLFGRRDDRPRGP